MSMHPKVSVLDLEWVANTQFEDSTEVDLIEIGIVNLDFIPDEGWKEIEQYTTLFHRQKEIPKRVAQLTGIQQSELQKAPAFYQVYELIELLTRGRSLVGHAIHIDYGHLQHEMQKHIKVFKREIFCTLEQARTQWPELRSYELSSLCQLYGTKNIRSHRALDDALNCAEIFKKLAPTPQTKKERRFNSESGLEHQFPWLSHSSRRELKNLKDGPTIYSLYSHNKLLWIGTVSNARLNLFPELKLIARDTQGKTTPVTTIKVQYENNEISSCTKIEKIKTRFRPTWQRQRPSVYGIFEYRDRRGLTRLKVRRAQENKKTALYYDLSKKRAEGLSKLWEAQLSPYHKLFSTDQKEQEQWIQKINKQRQQQLQGLVHKNSISIQTKDSTCKKTILVNPFQNIFYVERRRVQEVKLDLAGHCAVLDTIQKIKGRHEHPYLIEEFEKPFTLKHLQHFYGQSETLTVSPRP